MSSLAKKRQRIASSLSTSLDDLDEDVLLEILSYLYFVDLSETISVLSKSFLKISLTARVRHVCRPSVPRERLISREYDHYSLPFPDLMPDEKFGLPDYKCPLHALRHHWEGSKDYILNHRLGPDADHETLKRQLRKNLIETLERDAEDKLRARMLMQSMYDAYDYEEDWRCGYGFSVG